MQLQKYKSLIDNVLYLSRGSFSTNTYIEIQVRHHSKGFFEVSYTDGYKYLSASKIVKVKEVKTLLRAFKELN